MGALLGNGQAFAYSESPQSLRIQLAPSAVVDLERLWWWLAEKNPDAADRAFQAIVAAIDSLSQFPERGYGGPKGLRQLRVQFGKRGYVIRYRVAENEVRIQRIFHGLEDR